jgi:hypothetical protein
MAEVKVQKIPGVCTKLSLFCHIEITTGRRVLQHLDDTGNVMNFDANAHTTYDNLKFKMGD